MREQTLEHQFTRKMREKGALVRKVIFPSHAGAPDRIVLLPEGKLLWVELKAPGKKPSALQEREHQRLRSLGQRVEVIDSIEKINTLAEELCS